MLPLMTSCPPQSCGEAEKYPDRIGAVSVLCHLLHAPVAARLLLFGKSVLNYASVLGDGNCPRASHSRMKCGRSCVLLSSSRRRECVAGIAISVGGCSNVSHHV